MTLPHVSARASRVHRDAIIVDMHNDMMTKVLDHGYDPDVRHPAGFATGEGQTDLPRLVESGITAQFLAAWVDAPYGVIPGASYARAMEYVNAIDAFVARHPRHVLAARTAADVRHAKHGGKIRDLHCPGRWPRHRGIACAMNVNFYPRWQHAPPAGRGARRKGPPR